MRERRAGARCRALRIDAVGVGIRAAPAWRLDAARHGGWSGPARARRQARKALSVGCRLGIHGGCLMKSQDDPTLLRAIRGAIRRDVDMLAMCSATRI